MNRRLFMVAGGSLAIFSSTPGRASISSADWSRLMEQYREQQIRAGRSTSFRGTVRAINRQRGEVTFSHEPIASVGMPAMTMTLKVPDANVLAHLHVGGQVEIDARGTGGVPALISIKPTT